VDPVPLKTCNWNCVYCQLGRTTPLATGRDEFFPSDEIVREVLEALRSSATGAVDWVTVGGSGEPTLHASLGHILRELKAGTEVPLAVLTNGSLLDRPDVRGELRVADAVLPTLNGGTESVHRSIVRASGGPSLERHIEGLAAFRAVYPRQLWLEVMLVAGLNDHEEALVDLADGARRIHPDEIHLTLPVRPPAEVWVAPPSPVSIGRAAAILGTVAPIVVARPSPAVIAGRGGDLEEAILGVILRHPVAETELARMFGGQGEVMNALAALVSTARAATLHYGGETYWRAVRPKGP
jgi:wyosine [tRNA(Phe)-imidazoG37] synthetase (radical SAM superfamily)